MVQNKGHNCADGTAVTAVAKLGGAQPSGSRDSATPKPELAEFVPKLGPLGSSSARACSMNSASATAVVKSPGEDRPPESVMCNGTSESASAESAGDEGEAGSLWSRTLGTTSADTTTAAKLVGEAMPAEFVMCSATSEPEIEESRDEELTLLEQEELQELWELARNGWLV